MGHTHLTPDITIWLPPRFTRVCRLPGRLLHEPLHHAPPGRRSSPPALHRTGARTAAGPLTCADRARNRSAQRGAGGDRARQTGAIARADTRDVVDGGGLWSNVGLSGGRVRGARGVRCSMFFMGTYTPKLDDKGRLFLPAKFR